MAVRPIIFRGKRKDNGEWVEGSLIIAKNFCCILQDEEKVHPFDYPYLGNESGCIDGYATPVIPETVGQYTGLTDKNGKKIFEGDILKHLHTSVEIESYYEYMEVFYDEETASFYAGYEELWLICGGSEVIGNIHDNKLEDF